MLKLILIDAKTAGRHETFRVEDDEVEVIGRKAPRLLMPDTRVSRAHAEVRVQNGVWVIRDLGIGQRHPRQQPRHLGPVRA